MTEAAPGRAVPWSYGGRGWSVSNSHKEASEAYVARLAIGATKCLPVVKARRGTSEDTGLGGLVLSSISWSGVGVDRSPAKGNRLEAFRGRVKTLAYLSYESTLG